MSQQNLIETTQSRYSTELIDSLNRLLGEQTTSEIITGNQNEAQRILTKQLIELRDSGLITATRGLEKVITLGQFPFSRSARESMREEKKIKKREKLNTSLKEAGIIVSDDTDQIRKIKESKKITQLEALKYAVPRNGTYYCYAENGKLLPISPELLLDLGLVNKSTSKNYSINSPLDIGPLFNLKKDWEFAIDNYALARFLQIANEGSNVPTIPLAGFVEFLVARIAWYGDNRLFLSASSTSHGSELNRLKGLPKLRKNPVQKGIEITERGLYELCVTDCRLVSKNGSMILEATESDYYLRGPMRKIIPCSQSSIIWMSALRQAIEDRVNEQTLQLSGGAGGNGILKKTTKLFRKVIPGGNYLFK
jgi:hypothetical protein